jgi:hypothetical protein
MPWTLINVTCNGLQINRLMLYTIKKLCVLCFTLRISWKPKIRPNLLSPISVMCFLWFQHSILKVVLFILLASWSRQIGKQYFNMRLAPGDVSDTLSGFVHNAVTPIGMATPLPIILSHRIPALQPDFFFLVSVATVNLCVQGWVWNWLWCGRRRLESCPLLPC